MGHASSLIDHGRCSILSFSSLFLSFFFFLKFKLVAKLEYNLSHVT